MKALMKIFELDKVFSNVAGSEFTKYWRWTRLQGLFEEFDEFQVNLILAFTNFQSIFLSTAVQLVQLTR